MEHPPKDYPQDKNEEDDENITLGEIRLLVQIACLFKQNLATVYQQ